MKTLLITIAIIFAYTLGAFLHEVDIQRYCKERGFSGRSTWQGELVCSPVEVGVSYE